VTESGVSGDRQADGRYHGGVDRAVTLFSLERIDLLRAEGHPIGIGTTGENLTISRVAWDGLQPGARLRIGAVELELTKFASPCEKIAGSFAGGDFTRLSEKLHPGWSRLCARVVRGGTVRTGDVVEVVV
jgi:MOSC domain-containing protein YiiM